ncbi:recombination regulator RecX [Clostridium pasteurianum]|uniref:recombination regulator RecX n=1 Tax=Clostridium pasteurianum TaxID=1501 RepID=UPI003AAAA185
MIYLNKITKIEVQKKRKDRVNIYVNNEYRFSCSSELVFLHSLKSGMSIDVDYIEKIVEEENYIKCKNDALKAIEKSYKTEREISVKLLQKDHSEKNINRAIKFLKQYNFIDDCKYADLYIKEKIKKQGKKKIKYELLKKGIEENIIDDKLNNVSYEYEVSIINELARKKYNIFMKSENNSFKIYSKLFNYLSRLGYSSNIIKDTLKKIIGDITEDNNFIGNMKITHEKNYEELHRIAEKKYNLVIKNESNSMKVYAKLWRFLISKGYSSEDVKQELKNLME